MADKEKNPFAKFLTRFQAGTVLFHEGDEGDDMYIVQSGRVAIKKKVKDGEAVLATMEKGDFFGEMAILERMPRSATAEVVEDGDLIVISSEVFGDMIKANPEIAVRMLRKYSIRLRETNKQLENVMASGGAAAAAAAEVIAPKGTAGTVQAEAIAYFVSPQSGNVFPVFKSDALLGRYDSVTGMHPEIDLTAEDQSRNISRRHARLVVKDGRFFIAEEIGTMNGTFLNGKKLANGVLTPIADGDELVLCRLPLTFKMSVK
ncbi:MAG TPA: cyclic nucleotide-binding domain-containing protein [Vicinamibacteria bacterium]|nr:cyclic nucleotide-binding domain-containing protein [Vicinamibacteria bacterium]